MIRSERGNEIGVNILAVINNFTVGIYRSRVIYVLFRENIQNSKDAFKRALYLINNESSAILQGLRRDSISPDMNIVVYKDFYVLEDFGEGMTEDVLKKNFFAIACSTKGDDESVQIGLIGRFGIGGLTNVKVSTRLAVVTKNIYDGKTLFRCVKFGSEFSNGYELSYPYNVTDNFDEILEAFGHTGLTREIIEKRLEKFGTTIVTVLKPDEYLNREKVVKMVDEARKSLRFCEGKVIIESRMMNERNNMEDVVVNRIEPEEFIFPNRTDSVKCNRPWNCEDTVS